MDVITLHQAGFHHVVATLGTAFTERQMDQLWLLAPEPIICFDGDRAGEAAAARAIRAAEDKGHVVRAKLARELGARFQLMTP